MQKCFQHLSSYIQHTSGPVWTYIYIPAIKSLDAFVRDIIKTTCISSGERNLVIERKGLFGSVGLGFNLDVISRFYLKT